MVQSHGQERGCGTRGSKRKPVNILGNVANANIPVKLKAIAHSRPGRKRLARMPRSGGMSVLYPTERRTNVLHPTMKFLEW